MQHPNHTRKDRREQGGTMKTQGTPTPEQYRDILKAQGYGPTIGNHGLIFVHPPGGYKRSFVSYEEAYKHYNSH